MGPEATTKRRPSRAWFAVPALIVLSSFAVAVSYVARESNQVEDRIQSFERAGAPGQAELTFDEAGEYLLYVEGPVTPNSYIDPTEIILLPDEPGSRRTILRRFQGFVTYTDWATMQNCSYEFHNLNLLSQSCGPNPLPADPDLHASFEFLRVDRPQIPAPFVGADFSNPAAVSDSQLLALFGFAP